MSRKYTAQDMRETADDFENYADLDESVISEMLRQAADDLEREAKREREYEYSQRRHDERLGIDVVDMLHCSSLEGALDLHGRWNKNMPIVRREVGEWEEVDHDQR